MNQNLFYKNTERFILLASIKGLAEESRRTNKLLSKFKVNKNYYNYRYRKSTLSYESRYQLLAYTFLRGKKYQSIENKCSPDNKPSAEILYKTILQWAPSYAFSDKDAKWPTAYNKPTLGDVKIWLMPES